MYEQYGVVGGDRRQAELAKILKAEGNTVLTWGLKPWIMNSDSLEETTKAEIVVLPLPLCRNGFLNCGERHVEAAEILARLCPEQVVFAGAVRPEQRNEAENLGLELLDYLEREEMMEANAIPTAEGALQLAMERLPVTLCGTEVLILGYGRIGKQLARMLLALGARVTVAARKPSDRILAESLGCITLDSGVLRGKLNGFRLLINTVPALLLDRGLLSELRKDCLCIELASEAGVDFQAAKELGLEFVRAAGLPGRTAPETAARAIRTTIGHILEERRH